MLRVEFTSTYGAFDNARSGVVGTAGVHVARYPLLVRLETGAHNRCRRVVVVIEYESFQR